VWALEEYFPTKEETASFLICQKCQKVRIVDMYSGSGPQIKDRNWRSYISMRAPAIKKGFGELGCLFDLFFAFGEAKL